MTATNNIIKKNEKQPHCYPLQSTKHTPISTNETKNTHLHQQRTKSPRQPATLPISGNDTNRTSIHHPINILQQQPLQKLLNPLSQMKTIPLTQGKAATINDEDFELVAKHKWNATFSYKKWYANTYLNKKNIPMHRLIMNAQKGQIIDHADGNGLNNQKHNLRFCTTSQNAANSKHKKHTSLYKGVSFCKDKNKWRAGIGVNNKRIKLGNYRSQEQAAFAYNWAAKTFFGEFATINSVFHY